MNIDPVDNLDNLEIGIANVKKIKKWYNDNVWQQGRDWKLQKDVENKWGKKYDVKQIQK